MLGETNQVEKNETDKFWEKAIVHADLSKVSVFALLVLCIVTKFSKPICASCGNKLKRNIDYCPRCHTKLKWS